MVHPDGSVETKRFASQKRPSNPPTLREWAYASTEPYVRGTAPRYASLDGPRSLEACGADFGYGWYCIGIKRSRQKKANILIPEAGGRLHMFVDGRFKGVIGTGPGASLDVRPVELPGRASRVVFLADNPGRFSEGMELGQRQGLAGHLLDVKPTKLPKPSIEFGPRVDPFPLSGYVPRCHRDDRSPRRRYTFDVRVGRRGPLVLVMRGNRPRSVILVDDQPVAIDSADGVTGRYIIQPPEGSSRVKLVLSLIDEAQEGFSPLNHATLYETVENLSEEANWWYARWEKPADEAFGAMPTRTPALPCWYRTTFPAADTSRPLFLHIDGMSKGQIYLNGANVGRYFVGTSTGSHVPPQNRYYLPEPWLRTDGDNELILFEEHGKVPNQCRLVYDDHGPFGVGSGQERRSSRG